jgi:hypothetical protein
MKTVEVAPTYFLANDRLDIICKYLYVKSKHTNINYPRYKELYKKCIYQQTDAVEPIDKYIPKQAPKNNIQDYIDSFDCLINNFETQGYNKEYPIYSDHVKTINGGAHRIACSLYYEQNIPTVICVAPQPKYRSLDRKWFETEGFSEEVIAEWEETLVKLSGSR